MTPKALSREKILEHIVEMKEQHIKKLESKIVHLHIVIGFTSVIMFVVGLLIN